MKPEVARRQIASFEKRFGKPHLYLAYHAALPLALTPDLLYRLWANFPQDNQNQALNIPWVAVADILLSPLCEEVGRELYEMEGAVRDELLRQLQADKRFGQGRIRELSQFLLEYAQQYSNSHNPDLQDLARVQQWAALAYTKSGDAAQSLALAYTYVDQQDIAELVRLESLVETLAKPLGKFKSLLTYARGMGRFAHNDIEAAAKQLGKLPQHGSRIRVAGVSLPVPEEVRAQQASTLSRRRLLRWLGWSALGLGATVGVGSLLRYRSLEIFPELPEGGAPRDITLEPFVFDVVTVDGRGNVSNRERRQARQFIETLGDGVTLEMVSIPGGNFIMGAPEGEKDSSDDERPQHPVDVPPFFLGKYPVTQAQWAAVAALPKVSRDLERNPSQFQGADRPVEQISWYDAMEFCARLSQLTGTRYRLPSEAEWEYACRAGTTTPFHFGETITAELANYDGSVTYGDEPEGVYRQETTPVGSFQVANAFGLYDMHGLVWEWCADPWHENYEGAPSDGSVWEWEGNDNDNRSRLLRCGSWYLNPENCRSAGRLSNSPDDWLDDDGFRVVCALA